MEHRLLLLPASTGRLTGHLLGPIQCPSAGPLPPQVPVLPLLTEPASAMLNSHEVTTRLFSSLLLFGCVLKQLGFYSQTFPFSLTGSQRHLTHHPGAKRATLVSNKQLPNKAKSLARIKSSSLLCLLFFPELWNCCQKYNPQHVSGAEEKQPLEPLPVTSLQHRAYPFDG